MVNTTPTGGTGTGESSSGDDSVGGGTGLGDDTQDTGARGGGGSVDTGNTSSGGASEAETRTVSRSTTASGVGGGTGLTDDTFDTGARGGSGASTSSGGMPSVGVGSGPTTDQADAGFTRDTLQGLGAGFRRNVAEPVGDAARFASPATELDRFVPGNPVGRTVEGVNEGAVDAVNPGAAADGLVGLGQAAVEDTRNVQERGDAGRRENRQDAVNAASRGVAGFAGSVRSDPVGTLSRTAGGLVGGAVAGAAVSRGVRGGSRSTGSADVDTEPVPTGRSDVGTGGRDNILDADTVDDLSGTTGPSRASRARGAVSRSVDDVREGLDDLVSGGGTDRGQLQIGGQGRGRQRSPDTDSTPDQFTDFDRTDRVSDNLVQQSLNRQQRAGRETVDGGDFELGGDPFGPGTRRGTIGEDGTVTLDRSTGVVDDAAGQAGAGSPRRFDGFAGGTGAIAGVNDPTGIVPGDSASGESDTAAGVGGMSGIATGLTDETMDTGVSSGVGTGTTTGTDTDTEVGTDPGTDTDAGTDTGQATGGDVLVDEQARVGTAAAPTTATTPATVSMAEPIETTGTTGQPATPGIPRAGRRPRRTPRSDDRDESGADEEQEIDPLGAVGADFVNPTRGLDAASDNILDGIDDLEGPNAP